MHRKQKKYNLLQNESKKNYMLLKLDRILDKQNCHINNQHVLTTVQCTSRRNTLLKFSCLSRWIVSWDEYFFLKVYTTKFVILYLCANVLKKLPLMVFQKFVWFYLFIHSNFLSENIYRDPPQWRFDRDQSKSLNYVSESIFRMRSNII